MARFVFKLEGVLRQREHLERRRRRELAVANAQLQSLQAELRALNDDLQQIGQEMRQSHLTGRLDLSLLTAHRRYVLGMQRKAANLVQRLALAQRQVDAARQVLAEAAKQRRIIEKLRERQYERWQAEMALREAVEMDEITTQLSHRLNESGAK